MGGRGTCVLPMDVAAAAGKGARIPAASIWGGGAPPERDDLRRDWVSRDSEERWETELRKMDRGYGGMAGVPGQGWEDLCDPRPVLLILPCP